MLLCRTTVTIIPETPVQDCSISATWISLSAATRERNASLLALRFHYLVRLVLFQICFIYVFISLCAQLWREEKGLEVSQRSAIVTPCIAQVDHARFCAPTRFSLLIVTFPSSGSIFLPQGRKFPSPQSLRTSSNIFLRTFFFSAEKLPGTGDKFTFIHSFGFVFLFSKAPPFFLEPSTLLCKPTRLEVVPSCRESFFSPTDGLRRPDVREPMPGRCRDYALRSFILPLSRCSLLERLFPICSMSPMFSKSPPLGIPHKFPPLRVPPPCFWGGNFGYRSLSTRLPPCSLYRLPLLLLGIVVHVSVIRLLFFRSFEENKTVLLLCGSFPIAVMLL